MRHEIEIWFGVVDDAMCLISGNGTTAHWFLNAAADSSVSVRIGDETHDGRATVVDGAELRRRIGDVMRSKYDWAGDPDIGLTYDAWCYDVPAIAIEFTDIE